MALLTYADLQTQVANWLARSDLTAYIPDFITLFEATANRRLRVRQMEAVAALTTVSGNVILPSDYLGWKRVVWLGTVLSDLIFLHPSAMTFMYPTTPQGRPQHFSIATTAIAVRPIDDSAQIQLLYIQQIPALSLGVNWLYSSHPDIYLFGALAEAHAFIKDENRLALWKARRDELFDEIERLSLHTSGSGVIKTDGPTP